MTTESTETDRLMVKPELADLLGVHPNTLDNWHRRAYGPTRYLIGGKLMYRASEVTEWISSQVQA